MIIIIVFTEHTFPSAAFVNRTHQLQSASASMWFWGTQNCERRTPLPPPVDNRNRERKIAAGGPHLSPTITILYYTVEAGSWKLYCGRWKLWKRSLWTFRFRWRDRQDCGEEQAPSYCVNCMTVRHVVNGAAGSDDSFIFYALGLCIDMSKCWCS